MCFVRREEGAVVQGKDGGNSLLKFCSNRNLSNVRAENKVHHLMNDYC